MVEEDSEEGEGGGGEVGMVIVTMHTTDEWTMEETHLCPRRRERIVRNGRREWSRIKAVLNLAQKYINSIRSSEN